MVYTNGRSDPSELRNPCLSRHSAIGARRFSDQLFDLHENLSNFLESRRKLERELQIQYSAQTLKALLSLLTPDQMHRP